MKAGCINHDIVYSEHDGAQFDRQCTNMDASAQLMQTQCHVITRISNLVQFILQA